MFAYKQVIVPDVLPESAEKTGKDLYLFSYLKKQEIDFQLFLEPNLPCFKKTYIFNLLGKELEKILYEMIDKQREGEKSLCLLYSMS